MGDTLRESLARTAYERDAHARWGAAYFTPWEMLSPAIREHYWEAQDWIIKVVEAWLMSKVSKEVIDELAQVNNDRS